MRTRPERVAWIVLVLAFLAFCAIAVATPLGVRWYIRSAESERKALVESLTGTVVVEPPVGNVAVPLGKGQSYLTAGNAMIRVDENSEAVITFFDHSFMRLFPGTTIRMDVLSAPRFRAGQQPNRIHLVLLGGRVRIGTALSLDAPLEFRVDTFHAQVGLDADGSYALDASNELSEIVSYRGHATVSALDETVLLDARQRTQVTLGHPPQPAIGAARNLLVNGDFAQPIDESWRVFSDQGADGGEIDGIAELVIDEGRRGVRFLRQGGQGNHCETILEQNLNKQLPDPTTSLIVRAAVKVRNQSLPGGGYLSSEYPLMIRLTYRDVYDSEAEWVQGFYIRNEAGTPTTYGQMIPESRWYLYESSNLAETLPVRPFRLMKIRVYASGWDYDSVVSDISLIVE
jgi:hypothetical protein